MKHQTRLTLAGLLSVVALTVAACAGAGGGGGSMDQGGADNKGSGATESAESNGTRGMDQGSGGAASRRLMENGRYSDERFIDEMVPHHQGAVEMAEVALQNAEHKEIKRLSENIVSTQIEEIEELKEIKREEFGTSEVPMQMDEGRMEDMSMTDPESLADEEPFDEAFIEAMLPHHRSAVEMAEVAREKSDNPRIKELSGNIIEAQEREISQMQTWRESWYPEGQKGVDDAR